MGKRKEIKSTSKIKIEVENENWIKLINDTVYKDFLIRILLYLMKIGQ